MTRKIAERQARREKEDRARQAARDQFEERMRKHKQVLHSGRQQNQMMDGQELSVPTDELVNLRLRRAFTNH